MPAGKMAAQVAHACVRLTILSNIGNNSKRKRVLAEWFDPVMGNESKVVLQVKDEAELRRWESLCRERGILWNVVIDAAKTFFSEPTVTCLGIGPVTEEEAKMFKRVRLYEEDWSLDRVCDVVETIAYVDPESGNIHNKFVEMADLEDFLPEEVSERMVERSVLDPGT